MRKKERKKKEGEKKSKEKKSRNGEVIRWRFMTMNPSSLNHTSQEKKTIKQGIKRRLYRYHVSIMLNGICAIKKNTDASVNNKIKEQDENKYMLVFSYRWSP